MPVNPPPPRRSAATEREEMTEIQSTSREVMADFSKTETPTEIFVATQDSSETTRPLPAWKRFVLRRDPAVMKVIMWSASLVMVLFGLAVVFGIFYSGLTYTNPRGTGGSNTSSCETPFGTILGVNNGVFGYSNCNDQYVSLQSWYITVNSDATKYSGMQWQCVEYARRYWMLQGTPEPALFGDVDGAADIWDLSHVELVRGSALTRPLKKFKNNEAIFPPKRQDLLIYARRDGDFPVGHVAVIVDVALPVNPLQQNSTELLLAAHPLKETMGTRPGYVRLAEQNWASVPWVGPHHNYTRELPLHFDTTTQSFNIEDPAGPIKGWLRY